MLIPVAGNFDPVTASFVVPFCVEPVTVVVVTRDPDATVVVVGGGV